MGQTYCQCLISIHETLGGVVDAGTHQGPQQDSGHSEQTDTRNSTGLLVGTRPVDVILVG